MSERWAAIVYGRSYHVDFRFITLPYNFTSKDTAWALEHILATTQQARNLAGSPRWSLFKQDNFCIIGVTCMVRDLNDVMTRDDRGRPLYVFVGYVAQLEGERAIGIPAYGGSNIDCFQDLYREVEKVWSFEDYERDSRSPFLSQYQTLNCPVEAVSATSNHSQLNDRSKYPDKTYLWSSMEQQNQLLWRASAGCSQPTSLCLNIKGKALNNSPFLNQTVAHLEGFQIRNRLTPRKVTQASASKSPERQLSNSSLSQKITLRAKEDLDLTLQQAAKLAIASQELFDNFADWSEAKSDADLQEPDSQTDKNDDDIDSFGFKTKKSDPAIEERDWF